MEQKPTVQLTTLCTTLSEEIAQSTVYHLRLRSEPILLRVCLVICMMICSTVLEISAGNPVHRVSICTALHGLSIAKGLYLHIQIALDMLIRLTFDLFNYDLT